MTLQFRRARPEDLDRLLEIHLAAFSRSAPKRSAAT